MTAGVGQKWTYGLIAAVASPRNGKGPSRLFAINKAERRALATVVEKCTAEHRARHRDGTGQSRCADQAAEGLFAMGLAVSPSAGYARMNSRAFSDWAAFSQAP